MVERMRASKKSDAKRGQRSILLGNDRRGATALDLQMNDRRSGADRREFPPRPEGRRSSGGRQLKQLIF
jgi:hypothetical protein